MGIFSKIKFLGLRYSIAIAFNRVVPEWLFRCRRFVVYQLEAKSDSVRNPPPHVKVGCSSNEEQIQALESLTYVARKTVCDRDDSSDLIKLQPIQASLGGRLVGGCWLSSNQFQERELGVRYMLKPNQTWLFGALVGKGERGTGVYSAILGFVLSQAAEHGSVALAAVNPDNKRSNQAHKKNSSQTLGSVYCVRFLRVTVCVSSKKIKRDRTLAFSSNKNPILIRFDYE